MVVKDAIEHYGELLLATHLRCFAEVYSTLPRRDILPSATQDYGAVEGHHSGVGS